jgi:hypothetical protein
MSRPDGQQPGDVVGQLTIYAEAEVVRGAAADLSVEAEITTEAEVIPGEPDCEGQE